MNFFGNARAAVGDPELGEQYIAALMPLVWTACDREDFVPDVQAMRRRVEALVPAEVRDRELKLGRIDLISYLELELKTHEALSSYYDTQLELVKVIAQMIYLMGDSAIYQGDLYVFQTH